MQRGEDNDRGCDVPAQSFQGIRQSVIRDRLIEQFLKQHGYDWQDARPLAQDASFRRYLRLPGNDVLAGNAVLMDAPPPDNVRPFLTIAGHIHALGLSAPRIIASDAANGLVIEEDLGDDLYSTVMTPDNAASLLEAAIDALVVIQRAPPPVGLPAWDRAVMRDTACGTLFDWWWPAMHATHAPAAARADISEALSTILSHLEPGPTCFVHRDFFAGNLLWLPDRSGARQTGIIDFQGAANGHPAYDLVSLLQDARRDMPAEWEAAAITHYLAARPELDPAVFRAAYAVCAAQRHLRVACQWVRLARRDHRPEYLIHGPRTWRLLTRALREPATVPLAAALDRWVPEPLRRNPPEHAS